MGKALIMSQIEVGLGPVIGHKDFTVLKRTHGAGINVQIGIKFQKETLSPRASSKAPTDAEANPFPNELTTPPVTKMYLAPIRLHKL